LSGQTALLLQATVSLLEEVTKAQWHRGRRRAATIRLTNIPNLQPINEEDSND